MTNTEKRRRIIALRVRGLSIGQIARQLGIGATTVRYHLWVDATELEDRRETRGFYGNFNGSKGWRTA